MNKKIVTLILVILISFCFLSIVVADNATHNDKNTTNHDNTVNEDDDGNKNTDHDETADDGNEKTGHDKTVDKNKKTDKDKKKDKNKTDKSKKNYIIAKGNGNNIPFSDGFTGFIIDYSKHPASVGDKFKRASTSGASNSNALKQRIIESYLHDSENHIGKIMSTTVKSSSSQNKGGESYAAPHGKISDHEVVKINDNTEAIFDFELLKSVSGNESDYLAYKVSFRTIDDGQKNINQTNNLTNETNTTVNNTTNNTTNNTNITQKVDNGTNATALDGLNDYWASLLNAFYGAWKPLIGTLMNDFLMIVNALEGLADLFENFMAEIAYLMDGLETLLKMLESIFNELDGLLKLLAMILDFIQQILDLIQYILDLIMQIINAIIALIQELLELLFALIDFLMDLINQLISLIQAILDFLKSLGSFLVNVAENAVIIISVFVIITIGAFVYNRIR